MATIGSLRSSSRPEVRPVGHLGADDHIDRVVGEQALQLRWPRRLPRAQRAFRADRIAFLTGEVERLTGRAPRTFENWCERNAALFA